MEEPLTPKVAMLSALYAVLLIPLAFLLNIAMNWFTNNVLLELINWFNHQPIIWKIGLFVLGGGTFLAITIGIFRAVGNVLSFFIFFKLPDNTFTIFFSIAIYLLNVILGIINVWEITPKFSFWVFLEFVFLIFFVLYSNAILLPWYVKQKTKEV